MPIGLVELHRPAHGGDPNIVVQHVDAPVLGEHSVNDGLHLRRARDVAAVRSRLPTLARDDADRFLRGFGMEVDAGDDRTLPRVKNRRSLAVAPPGPDRPGPEYDRHLALEPLGHPACPLPSLFSEGSSIWSTLRRGKLVAKATWSESDVLKGRVLAGRHPRLDRPCLG